MWLGGAVLLRGGTVLDLDGERVADVVVGADGRIAEVGPDLGARHPGAPVTDVSGLLVVPGGVDAHTHMQLPVGAVRVSDDFASGTAAAAVGGTTTVVDYVTAYRGEDPLAALATWRRWAEPAAVDVGLHMTFTEAVPESVVAGCIERGVTSFKLYLAYPQLLQVDDEVVFDVLAACARLGGLVTVHCENGGAIEALRRRAVAEGRTSVVSHRDTRPAALEAEAVSRVGRLAEVAGGRPCTSSTCRRPRGWPRCGRPRSGACPCTPRPARSTSTSTPPCWRGRTARTSCARRRCGTRSTEELWEGLARGLGADGGDRPLPVLDARPADRDGRRPGDLGRLHRDPRRAAGGGDPAHAGVAGRAGRPDHGRRLGPPVRRGPGPDLRAVPPPRAACARARTPTSWCGTRSGPSPWTPRPCTCGWTTRRTRASWPGGWPALVLCRGRVVARDGEFCGEQGWGRYVERGPPTCRSYAEMTAYVPPSSVYRPWSRAAAARWRVRMAARRPRPAGGRRSPCGGRPSGRSAAAPRPGRSGPRRRRCRPASRPPGRRPRRGQHAQLAEPAQAGGRARVASSSASRAVNDGRPAPLAASSSAPGPRATARRSRSTPSRRSPGPPARPPPGSRPPGRCRRRRSSCWSWGSGPRRCPTAQAGDLLVVRVDAVGHPRPVGAPADRPRSARWAGGRTSPGRTCPRRGPRPGGCGGGRRAARPARPSAA